MPDKLPNVPHLLHHLQHDEQARRVPVAARPLDPPLARLRAWQAQRLARTYADLAANPRYAAALDFFLSDVYAPRDFSQRDDDVERMHAFLSRLLPAQMLQLLADTVELNHLTAALDQALLRALVDQLGVADTLTAELYAQGYRLCNNLKERAYQIELIEKILIEVGEGTHIRGVGMALKLARAPVEHTGWGELYDFVERGYAAFNPIRDTAWLARTIRQRETQILNQIFDGAPDPFAV